MADELPATLPIPPHGWTCFYCGETFTTIGSASDHFGSEPFATTACQIKAGDERGLVMALREAEGELSRYRAEDSDKDREFAALASSIGEKVRLAEEAGYAKALADVEAGKVEPEHRDRILAALRAPRADDPEAVEAVARAIHDYLPPWIPSHHPLTKLWKDASAETRMYYSGLARAALAAIRPADPGPCGLCDGSGFVTEVEAIHPDPTMAVEYPVPCPRCRRPADPGPGAWQPIETAPMSRPILWRASPGAQVSVINTEYCGECYATPGSLWCEIPPERAALPQPASDMRVATDAASDRNRPAAGEARAEVEREIVAFLAAKARGLRGGPLGGEVEAVMAEDIASAIERGEHRSAPQADCAALSDEQREAAFELSEDLMPGGFP